MARVLPLLPVLLVLLLGSAPLRADDERMFDPTFREGRASDVLHEGPPTLLRSVLNAYVDLLETSFDLALTREQERALRDVLETSYGEDQDEEGRRGLLALVAPVAAARRAARAGDPRAVTLVVQDFRRATDESLTASPDTPVHRVVRGVLARRLEVVWPGSRPVTAPAADAWLDLVEFLVSLARNEEFRATPGQHDVLRRELSTAFLGAPDATRKRLGDAHRTWLRLKAAWDDADLARRIDLRWKAMGLLAKLLPRERRITVGASGDLVAYARAAAILRPTQSAYAAWSNAAAHPERVLEPVDAWLGPITPANDRILLYR